MAIYFLKKKHAKSMPVQYLLLTTAWMDFRFGFQKHISFGVSDFNTNCKFFQEQDDQQHFLWFQFHSFRLQENTVLAKLTIKKQTNQNFFSFSASCNSTKLTPLRRQDCKGCKTCWGALNHFHCTTYNVFHDAKSTAGDSNSAISTAVKSLISAINETQQPFDHIKIYQFLDLLVRYLI